LEVDYTLYTNHLVFDVLSVDLLIKYERRILENLP
jgi:hypothetical protein